jgi:PAS domain S-box-containing protein
MKRWVPDLHRLSAQMLLSFLVLVLLTAAAAGLPAIWLIRAQLQRQAWSQVEQGRLAAEALYEARETELTGLATLMAQRPTLRELLVQDEPEALQTYLRTLQEGSGLDLVLVCGSEQQVLASAGQDVPSSLCAPGAASGFHLVPQGAGWRGWLFAAHPLADEDAGLTDTVVAAVALDARFATRLAAETGLDHALLVDGQPLATSLDARRALASVSLDELGRTTYHLNRRPYYAARFPLDSDGLEAEVALDVSDLALTQRTLVLTLVSSILAVVVVASLLGTFLARRIGRPLTQLADAAGAMSQGELDRPLAVQAGVREVTLVAQALEGARVDLKRSLAELRQEKAWTDHLLEAIVEGIVTLDRRGHVTFFSHGAERITGWHREEVTGRPCDQVFVPIESDEPFSQLLPAPGRRTKISVEMRDGREAILAFTGARLLPREAGDARVALVFRDVSEEEIVHRLMGHFLANVAHEFRTPLSALAASVELLLDQAPDLSTAELGELLTSLHLGVLGLQTLIDNLLESASIETGHFHVHPRPAHLGDIVAEALATMQPLLDKHGQCLVVELPAAIPTVQADPRRTVQVLINLLSNASKYGPDDSEIEVSTTVQGKWARVSVADSGPGIPPEYRAHLFRRFVSPRSGLDHAQVGAGLGLSVVKAIVEAHGGEVGVAGRPDGGSAFWFTLPLEEKC